MAGVVATWKDSLRQLTDIQDESTPTDSAAAAGMQIMANCNKLLMVEAAPPKATWKKLVHEMQASVDCHRTSRVELCGCRCIRVGW